MSATSERPALSLVIPAYDESQRLRATLGRVDAFLREPPRSPVELVLVDDGSNDRTLEIMREFAEGRPEIQVVANAHRGKAFAVRSGMLAARGDVVFFSDADLSTPLDESRRLLRALEKGAHVAIGSREGTGARREDEPFYRHLMGRGFNFLVQLMLVPGVRDTQCGFKMFSRQAARAIFSRLRRYGPDAPIVKGPMVTAFDVEVLFLARKLGFKIAEVPVQWKHEVGSKVRPMLDAIRMARDVG
ncbi:MAG TPA: dolichyl-phosphate beta-glucosyltransferase, partial [Planctomycetota bacterium]|nr:dolichyl-phosphate beta-glucosyltransferase [Planctomycetota bacterium]